jgi:hypothetical protein
MIRTPFFLAMALVPGLCDKPPDPSQGVPKDVWHLREVMEAEVTRGEDGALSVTEEQARKMKEAADAVLTWENMTNPDVIAEVVYLLPRTWIWEQRTILRDLLVLLGGGAKAGAVLEREQDNPEETGYRREAMLAILKLHRALVPLEPAERAEKILGASSTWEDPRFGWKGHLMYEYGEMAMAHAAPHGRESLEALSAEKGRRSAWARRVLERTAGR